MKFPVYFLHFWLPKAHVEAPTRARMILAGLLLKVGTGGYLRIVFLLDIGVGLLLIVCFFGILLGSFFCVIQSDLKALAAFSSINHMSFLLFVLLFSSLLGKFGAVLVMVSHGFISTLLFFFIGEFYHLRYTRNFFFFGGFFF
jgi:NADH:ubiquinone oxidoreductase subunit 4 (subunit M)